MKPVIRSAIAAAVLAASGGAAYAGVNSQCPAGPAGQPVLHTTNSADGPTNARVCAHLAAGDGWSVRADGGRHYMFGFSDVTGIADENVMTTSVFNAKWSAPTLAFREGQEVFLSLTNVGMLHRPDLFDPHSVHFHGFPQAAPVYDGVPDGSAVINMGSTFTYYYKLNDPGTYIYHCHVESTEHMHMGMLGTLYVKPKQDGQTFADGLMADGVTPRTFTKFAYNDGNGKTGYDVDYPLQLGGFDGKFHDLHEAVQPLPFEELKSTHTFINGRGYPYTVWAGEIPHALVDPEDPGSMLPEPSQVVPALITATSGQRILLRLSNSSVAEFFTVTTLGLKMEVVGQGASIARGLPGTDGVVKDWKFKTASVTLGGGESVDVLVDTAGVAPGTYFLYTTNLNYLSNGAEDRGGIMTHIVIN